MKRLGVRGSYHATVLLALASCNAGDPAESASEATGLPVTTVDATETSPPTTTEATTAVTGSATSTSDGADDTETAGAKQDVPKFDVGTQPDGGNQGCGGGGGGMADFSYIYIANTVQGTISKLNTQTMVEEGRYITRPDSAGSPSRTSVNLSGDVAVANRNGGITKFYAREEDCQDTNGMAGIQTSQALDDILAWDVEECRAWHTPFAYYTQRPVAWTAGTYDPATCSWNDQKLWTSGTANGGTVQVVLLDGDTGAVDFMVDTGVTPGSFGAYGGAVDLEGDFWIIGQYTSGFPLVEIELTTQDFTIHPAPAEVHGYGITVDHNGRIWIGADVGNTARFDPVTEMWALVPGVTGLGIQEHPDGYMWMGTFPTRGIQAIDVESLALGPFLALPSTSQTKGVSIDFYGYVWLVDMQDTAYRIDPNTLAYDTYAELDQPYTYSDMTGWGLSNVAPPAG